MEKGGKGKSERENLNGVLEKKIVLGNPWGEWSESSHRRLSTVSPPPSLWTQQKPLCVRVRVLFIGLATLYKGFRLLRRKKEKPVQPRLSVMIDRDFFSSSDSFFWGEILILLKTRLWMTVPLRSQNISLLFFFLLTYLFDI